MLLNVPVRNDNDKNEIIPDLFRPAVFSVYFITGRITTQGFLWCKEKVAESTGNPK
jgi:hypothetical protein